MEKRELNDDQDDIESNLLLPAGMTLRWATLSLKVFRAEDIPQSKTRCSNYFIIVTNQIVFETYAVHNKYWFVHKKTLT